MNNNEQLKADLIAMSPWILLLLCIVTVIGLAIIRTSQDAMKLKLEVQTTKQKLDYYEQRNGDAKGHTKSACDYTTEYLPLVCGEK